MQPRGAHLTLCGTRTISRISGRVRSVIRARIAPLPVSGSTPNRILGLIAGRGPPRLRDQPLRRNRGGTIVIEPTGGPGTRPGPGRRGRPGRRPGRRPRPTGRGPTHKHKDPWKKARDEKGKDRGGKFFKALKKAAAAATEAMDTADDLWRALPARCKTRIKGQRTTPDQKMVDIWKCKGLNSGYYRRAAENFARSQAEDWAWGTAGRNTRNPLTGRSGLPSRMGETPERAWREYQRREREKEEE